MRKIDQDISNAFNNNAPCASGNTAVTLAHLVGTTGKEKTLMVLHGHCIAEKWQSAKKVYITLNHHGFKTATTKSRLNLIDGVEIVQKAGKWYCNGELWPGNKLMGVKLNVKVG